MLKYLKVLNQILHTWCEPIVASVGKLNWSRKQISSDVAPGFCESNPRSAQNIHRNQHKLFSPEFIPVWGTRKNRTISPLTTISWIICFVLFLEAGSCSSLRPLTLFNVANCWKPAERKAIGHPPLGLVICVIQIVNLFVFCAVLDK